MGQPVGLEGARLLLAATRELLSKPDRLTTREQVVRIGGTLTGSTGAAIVTAFLPRGTRVGVATDPQAALSLSRIAGRTGAGPCVQALADGRGIRCESVQHERRWPTYASMVLARTDIRSEAAYPLRIEGYGDFGVLSLFSTENGHFNDAVGEVAEAYAGHAAMALAMVEGRYRAANLQLALDSNRAIGTAVGILMTSKRMTEQQAFDLLVGDSQRSHRKLRDVADDVVLSGELPVRPGSQADSHLVALSVEPDARPASA